MFMALNDMSSGKWRHDIECIEYNIYPDLLATHSYYFTLQKVVGVGKNIT